MSDDELPLVPSKKSFREGLVDFVDTSSNTYAIFMIPISSGLIGSGWWLLLPMNTLGLIAVFVRAEKTKEFLEFYNTVAEDSALVFTALQFFVEQVKIRQMNPSSLKTLDLIAVSGVTAFMVPWQWYVEKLQKRQPNKRLPNAIFAINLIFAPIQYVAAFDTIIEIFSGGFEILSEDVEYGLWLGLVGAGFVNEVVRHFSPTLARPLDHVAKLGFEVSVAAFLFTYLNDLAVMIHNKIHPSDQDDLPWWCLIITGVVSIIFAIHQVREMIAHLHNEDNDAKVTTPLLSVNRVDSDLTLLSVTRSFRLGCQL